MTRLCRSTGAGPGTGEADEEVLSFLSTAPTPLVLAQVMPVGSGPIGGAKQDRTVPSNPQGGFKHDDTFAAVRGTLPPHRYRP